MARTDGTDDDRHDGPVGSERHGRLVHLAVNVTLAATDNANGSGVDKTEYRVDGGAFAPYTAPIALTTSGTHTIEYRSTDKSNNVEATKSLDGQDRQGGTDARPRRSSRPPPGPWHTARWT